MDSFPLFGKLPPEIQLQIWDEYFKTRLVHKIGITKADEELNHPRILRSYTHRAVDPASRRSVSVARARAGLLANRAAYEVFRANYHALTLGFHKSPPDTIIPQFPLNVFRDLVYLTNIHPILLSKLCSQDRPYDGKVRHVAFLFNNQQRILPTRHPYWQYPWYSTPDARTVFDEILLVMAASSIKIPNAQLLLGQLDEYGFVTWESVASLPFLTSQETTPVELNFKDSEKSLKESEFPYSEMTNLKWAIDLDA
ncbi:hypothetical protein GGR52DRAFT_569981 [Hypoxylon sp. FL1284]|nr:hypothetical protein GGR52DRAFT_569981 [Hypoxylon sp. FL1284]